MVLRFRFQRSVYLGIYPRSASFLFCQIKTFKRYREFCLLSLSYHFNTSNPKEKRIYIIKGEKKGTPSNWMHFALLKLTALSIFCSFCHRTVSGVWLWSQAAWVRILTKILFLSASVSSSVKWINDTIYLIGSLKDVYDIIKHVNKAKDLKPSCLQKQNRLGHLGIYSKWLAWKRQLLAYTRHPGRARTWARCCQIFWFMRQWSGCLLVTSLDF